MRWWQVAAAVLMLVSAQATPGRADDRTPSSLAQRLDAAIAAFRARAGVVVTDPRHGDRYAHEAGRVFPSASLYKLGVMVEAYRRVADGSLSLSSTITVLDEDDEESYTPVGETLTLGDAIERMITISDNTTAHMLVRILDAHRINATVAALGLTDTRINTPLTGEERTAPFNTTSARDMERLFVRLVNGTMLGPAFSGAMLATLGRQRVNDRLPTGVPPGTFVAHKTGNLDRIAHDAGVIVTPGGPRVVVVLTSEYGRYDDVIELTRRVAELAFDGGLAGIAAQSHPAATSSAAPAALIVPETSATTTETVASTEPGEEAPQEAASTLASGAPTPSALVGRPVPSTTSAEEPPPPSMLLAPPNNAWTYTTKSPDADAWAKTPSLLVGPAQALLGAPALLTVPWALPLKEPESGSQLSLVRGPASSLTVPKTGPTLLAPAGPAASAPVGTGPAVIVPSVAKAPSLVSAPSTAIPPSTATARSAKTIPAAATARHAATARSTPPHHRSARISSRN